MSAIRPDLPIATPPTSAPARNAQAAFFRAALGQAQGPQATTTALKPAITPSTTSAREGGETTRSTRPGSLLDIRV